MAARTRSPSARDTAISSTSRSESVSRPATFSRRRRSAVSDRSQSTARWWASVVSQARTDPRVRSKRSGCSHTPRKTSWVTSSAASGLAVTCRATVRTTDAKRR